MNGMMNICEYARTTTSITARDGENLGLGRAKLVDFPDRPAIIVSSFISTSIAEGSLVMVVLRGPEWHIVNADFYGS